MWPGNLVDELTPYARVATAVLPFVLTVIFRIVWGKNRATGWLFTFSLAWFVTNMLIAPFSAGLRQDLVNLVARWL